MKKETIFSQGKFKYFVVNLPKEFYDTENYSFVFLLKFIGKQPIYKEYGKTDIGRAYSVIREKTNNKLGLTKKDLVLRTSKREVASIRRYFDPNLIRQHRYIKMPYKLEYIFSSIIDVLNELKDNPTITENDKEYSSNLSQYIGNTYCDAFYKNQRKAYMAADKRAFPVAQEFDSDFDSHNSPLNKVFRKITKDK